MTATELVILITALLLVLGDIAAMTTLFAVGAKKLKSGDSSGRLLVTIACVMLAVGAVLSAALFMPGKVEINTPNGTAVLRSDIVKRYDNAVKNGELDSIEKLLDKYPQLVWRARDNSFDALQYFANTNNVEGVKLLTEHGAYFDNGITLEGFPLGYAFQNYFAKGFEDGASAQTRCEIVTLMTDNGAQVNYDPAVSVTAQNESALQSAVSRICRDDIIEDAEAEMVRVIVQAGADLNAADGSGHTALEAFELNKLPDDENTREVYALLVGNYSR